MGYKKDPIRKGGHWFFWRASHPLVFPLRNFLFLPDRPARSLYLCTCLTGMVYDIFISCGTWFADILLRIFATIFIKSIDHNFLFWWYLNQGNSGFIECFRDCSLLFSLLEEFEKNQCKFFFVFLGEFTCEAICSWTFVYMELKNKKKNYRYYFTSSDWPVQMIYFFLIQFWWTVCF